MSKPEWEDAPECARWVAMDEDGDWFWHKSEPVAMKIMWVSIDPYPTIDLYPKYAGRTDCCVNWNDTLEKRPS